MCRHSSKLEEPTYAKYQYLNLEIGPALSDYHWYDDERRILEMQNARLSQLQEYRQFKLSGKRWMGVIEIQRFKVISGRVIVHWKYLWRSNTL